MADDRPSRKELARTLRRQAYQAAKERRANDPRYIALKEAAKQQRRDAYRKAKEQRKAAGQNEKQREAERVAEKQTTQRAAMDAELMKLVKRATSKGPYEIN